MRGSEGNQFFGCLGCACPKGRCLSSSNYLRYFSISCPLSFKTVSTPILFFLSYQKTSFMLLNVLSSLGKGFIDSHRSLVQGRVCMEVECLVRFTKKILMEILEMEEINFF